MIGLTVELEDSIDAAAGARVHLLDAKGMISSADVGDGRALTDLASDAGRAITNAGQCDGDVGNTVDEASASYLNSIGDAELRAVRTDPGFDASLRAIHSVRVLDIPSPTRQSFDQEFFEIEMTGDVPLSHQERAYTSPILFTP